MTALPAFLTVAEAAAYLRVHPETIRRLVRRGELTAIKVGSVWRVPVDALERPTQPSDQPARPRQPSGRLSRRARVMIREG